MPVAKGVTQHLKKIWYNEGKNNGGFHKTVIAHKNFLCHGRQSLGTLDKTMQSLRNLKTCSLMKRRQLKVSSTSFLHFNILKFMRKRKLDEEDIQNDSQCYLLMKCLMGISMGEYFVYQSFDRLVQFQPLFWEAKFLKNDTDQLIKSFWTQNKWIEFEIISK